MITTLLPCGLCVGSAEQHPAPVPRPSQLTFSASSAATLAFFYRALFSLFLLTGHQCIAFPFKVNPIEPNFILDPVILWNSAPQKWNTLFYSLLAQGYSVFWSRALSFLLEPKTMSESLLHVHFRQLFAYHSLKSISLSLLSGYLTKLDFFLSSKVHHILPSYYKICDSDNESKISPLFIPTVFSPSLGKPDFPN